jgi:hypothetical protein
MKIQDILEAFDSSHQFSDIDRHRDEDGDEHDTLSTNFRASDGSEVVVYFEPEHNDTWLIHFERQSPKGSYRDNISGQGDAFKIYATVLKIIEKFINKKKPKSVTFNAKKTEFDSDAKEKEVKSRAKLYDRLINKFASKMGYRLSRKVDTSGMAFYILDRV